MFKLPFFPEMLSISLPGMMQDDPPPMKPVPGWYGAPFGRSRRTTAQDKRASMKRRAVKRARKFGHA